MPESEIIIIKIAKWKTMPFNKYQRSNGAEKKNQIDFDSQNEGVLDIRNIKIKAVY